MATVGTTVGYTAEVPRYYQKCRKIGVTFASVDDGDTFVAGPSVMATAWESGTADTGEVHWAISDRATGTVTADCAASGNVGTLWLFYGASSQQ